MEAPVGMGTTWTPLRQKNCTVRVLGPHGVLTSNTESNRGPRSNVAVALRIHPRLSQYQQCLRSSRLTVFICDLPPDIRET